MLQLKGHCQVTDFVMWQSFVSLPVQVSSDVKRKKNRILFKKKKTKKGASDWVCSARLLTDSQQEKML